MPTAKWPRKHVAVSRMSYVIEVESQRVGHSGKQVSDPGELTVYCGQGLHTPLPAALYVFDPHMRGVEVGEHACPGGHLQSDTPLEPK